MWLSTFRTTGANDASEIGVPSATQKTGMCTEKVRSFIRGAKFGISSRTHGPRAIKRP